MGIEVERVSEHLGPQDLVGLRLQLLGPEDRGGIPGHVREGIGVLLVAVAQDRLVESTVPGQVAVLDEVVEAVEGLLDTATVQE